MHFYQQISETVNFLNSFEKMFEDLYQPDIVRLRYAVENIFDAMPIAQFFSKYAFDKRSTTKVLLTCLNQMVISCVQYLTDDFTVTFWSQSKSILLKKLELCIELKDHVFYCHNKSVNKINIEDREPFRVLFITSFGNFVEFINRLDKVSTLIIIHSNKSYINIYSIYSISIEYFYIKQGMFVCNSLISKIIFNYQALNLLENIFHFFNNKNTTLELYKNIFIFFHWHILHSIYGFVNYFVFQLHV